jgi:hypothetical protein
MNIIFTTLSLGFNYTKDYSLKLINDILTKTPHSIAVTTDFKDVILKEYPNEKRIIINEIDRNNLTIRINTDWGMGNDSDFNFNIRYMCFEPVKSMTDCVIIFTDCDNSLDWWDEDVIQNWLKIHIEQGYEFFGPRTELKYGDFVKKYKSQKEMKCDIFWHKLYNYDLLENSKVEWYDAPLPAEYLLIFYNKENKIEKFYDQWKWFHDYLVNKGKSYGTWAEGFEIGVSSLVANMKSFDIGWSHPIWKTAINPNGYKIGHPTEK